MLKYPEACISDNALQLNPIYTDYNSDKSVIQMFNGIHTNKFTTWLTSECITKPFIYILCATD